MAMAEKDPIRDLTDRAIRDSLRHAEHLRGLLSQVVPDLVDGFAFDQLRQLDREFPMEDWRRREADLPLEIPYRVGDDFIRALVVVLLEHQSEPDPMMPLRMLYFAVVYWDQQWRAWEELPSPKRPFRLNPVLPIVIHTGATPWRSNRTLADLFGEPSAFHGFAPSWQPLFWNLAEQSASDLLSSENNWLQMMAVLRVEQADANTFREVFTEALQQVKKIKGEDNIRWYDLMRILLTWVYWRRNEAERPALLKAAEAAQVSVRRKGEVQQMTNKLGPSFWDLAMERATELAEKQAQERVEQQVRQQVRQQVQQQVRLAAMDEAKDILKTLLHDKFGRLPRKLEKQIDGSDNADQLRNAIRNAHRCPSLREFQL